MLALRDMHNPDTGENGVLVRFLDANGGELFREDRRSTALVYFGGQAPITSATDIELTTRWTPAESGRIRIGFAAVGRGRVYLNGQLAVEDTAHAVGQDLGASLLAPPSVSAPVDVTAGTPIDIRVEFDMSTRASELEGAFAITVGTEPDSSDPDTLIAQAVSAARAADVAVVVVGTNSRVESEGFDRTDLTLPGDQDRLVQAVAATGTPTVVVVNAGSPVLLPWRNEVAAILLPYFGGQDMGRSLADILLGIAEPGGRLPTTWPATLDDVPVLDVTPRDGKVHYSEGIHIGYRAWLKAGIQPAYPFGHGLGYTTWRLDDAAFTAESTGAGSVVARITNTGTRTGKQVLQAYLSHPLNRPGSAGGRGAYAASSVGELVRRYCCS